MIYSSNLQRWSRVGLMCALAAGAAFANADLKVVSKVTVSTLRGPKVVTVVSWFKGSMIRIDNGDVRKISDSRTHKTILLNMPKKLYIYPDSAQALKDAAASIQKQHMKIDAHIAPTGKHRKIAGRDATQYKGTLTVSGDYPKMQGSRAEAKFVIDEWTTTARGVTVSQSDMMGTVSELLQSLAGVGGMQKVTQELSKIKGVPLNTDLEGTMTIYASSGGAPQTQKHSYITEATTVNEETLPMSAFQVPPGFTEVGGKKPMKPSAGKGGKGKKK